jgi:CRP/FNR family cyclic AMP-dependent transcriptional regulator
MQLGDVAKAMFLAVATMEQHARGTMLISQSDEDQRVCLLIKGRADVLTLAPDGKLVIFDEVGPGSMVGILAALDGGVRSASVQACSPGQTAWVNQAAFRKLLQQPHFAREIHAQLATIIRHTSQRVFELSTLIIRDRLIRELLRRYDMAADEVDGQKSFRIKPLPSQSHLAACIGTSREAVAREMSRLTRLGLISRDKYGLVVPSRHALMTVLV